MTAKKNIVKEPPKLSPRQERFCQEYLKDLNGMQAALRAGYAQASARSQASDLLTRPHIQTEIARLNAERSKRTGITTDWVLNRLREIASVDLGEMFNKTGGMKDIHDIPKSVRRSMAGIETVEMFSWGEHVGNTKKVKLNDKVRALELIGKHLAMWNEKPEAPPPQVIKFKIGWGDDDENDRNGVDAPTQNATTKKDKPE